MNVSVFPEGHCRCGCGGKTELACYTSIRRGHVKGNPLPFVKGHHRCVSPENRLWSRVVKSPDPDGCWIYAPDKRPRHRGMAIHNKKIYVHRLSYEIHFGPVPDGMDVLHKCDNPPCVRPDHLFLGDHQTNMDDRDHKGRSCKKLTHEDARTIVKLRRDGIGTSDLAAKYGVSSTMIKLIVRGISHKAAMTGTE